MTAPLTPTSSADLGTASARDWALQVDTGTTGTPSWAFVKGLDKILPTEDPTFQDDADLDSLGAKSKLKTADGWSIDCDGLRKGAVTAGVLTPDPGQEFLRAKSLQTGYLNVVKVRWWRTDSLEDSFTGTAAVEWKSTGGGKEELEKFSLMLHGRGPKVAAAKPVAE